MNTIKNVHSPAGMTNGDGAFWVADPHRFGPGKVHAIDAEDPSRTYCGKLLSAIPGKMAQAKEATCQTCVQAPIKRQQRKATREQWQQEYERQKAEEKAAWRAAYESHIKSDKWKSIRQKVIQRAHGICEGCGFRPAAQAHHLTYEHLGEEFLWELRAVCLTCHERIHSDKYPWERE